MNYNDLYYNFNEESAIIEEYRVYNKQLDMKGTLFKLVTITKEMEEFILKWKNTELVTTQARYAPEIKRRAVIIYDRKIRA